MRIHTKTVWRLTDDPNEFILVSDDSSDYRGAVALADRAAQGQAGQAEKQASSTAGSYGTQAQNLGNTLIPTLKNDINNPTGFTPTENNNMLVAGEQGAGGALAGVTGQAGLQAARTRNSGSSSGILDQAMRRNAQTLSGNALNVQNQSAKLAQEKRASALGGLEGMYGTDVGAQLKAMGIIPSDISAEVQAGNSGWLQQGEGLLNTFGNLGKDAAQSFAALQ